MKTVSTWGYLLLTHRYVIWTTIVPAGVVIGFEMTEYSIAESGGSVVLVVHLRNGSIEERVVPVLLELTNGTALRECVSK